MTSIELVQLAKTYPRQRAPAVTGLSLAVAPNTLLALLGPSGSGKSTILKLIAGIEAPDSGSILLDGRDMAGVPAHKRRAVLMFQKAHLFPFLSVAENIAFGLRAHAVPRATVQAEVARMLALVELPELGKRRPAQLSGGEQQRVALARALVVRPRVLLLDEPFSSLDPTVRQALQEAVGRIVRELGITTVLVSHDRGEALAMADRVVLLEAGALVAHDTPRSLFTRPPTRRAARQMGVETFLCGEVAGGVLYSELGPLALGEGRADGPGVYAIRPEHLRLLPGPAPNAVAATVQAQTFRGAYVEVLLCAGGTTMRAHAPPGAGALGASVYVQLPPERLFPVDDDISATEPKGPSEHSDPPGR